MERRTEMEDADMHLERQTFNLNYDRWLLLYKDRVLAGLVDESGEIPLGIDDLADLDRYMAEQEAAYLDERQREEKFQNILTGTHTMSGASAAPAPIDWRATQEEQWGPWL
jgi:hypothetical protein